MTLNVPDQLIRQQRLATDPDRSAWVMANAGSGKTYVLVRRVLRLLLAGVDPARLLCLTFTTAAAAQMADRISRELATWALAEEDALVTTLQGLLGRDANRQERARARQLFALAIETPGRLKIQTIHAFCERVLQLFPFEAGVPAGFAVLDEARTASLIDQALAQVLVEAHHDRDGDLSRALDVILDHRSESQMREALAMLIGRRGRYAEWRSSGGTAFKSLDLDPADRPEDVLNDFAQHSAVFALGPVAVAEALGADKGVQMQKLGTAFAALDAGDRLAHARLIIASFVTATNAPKAKFPAKSLYDSAPILAEAFDKDRDLALIALDRLLALDVAMASAALFHLADRVLDTYAALKAAASALDFDDLIDRMRLLLESGHAAWVLYRLDRGIDHILVDEAQDTSPEQWRIIRALAEEFFAGEGARQGNRTIFAVGDEKQSIYSFQGADPAGFLAMRRHFARRVEAAEKRFERIELTHSFRSTQQVLEAVDSVFVTTDAARGLAEPGGTVAKHGALRQHAGGLVELWPPVETDANAAANPWDAPLDRDDDRQSRVVLARRIAAKIKTMIDAGIVLPSTGAPAREGDFLILLRKRAGLARPLIKALKDAGLKVAGADRLRLASHIAVADLIGLGALCSLPDDDLTLAAVLKSPLFGLTEADIYSLAVDRDGSLFAALAAAKVPHLQNALARLQHWRRLGLRLRPFDFYATVLGAAGGRDALRARLGVEALDPIDEFLSMALDYERDGAAALPGFIAWMAQGHAEIKRDMDEHGGEIRIMTVHGSKGLEAPVVFLPDTLSAPTAGDLDAVLFVPGGDLFTPAEAVLWMPKEQDSPAKLRAWRDQALAAAEEEYRRLFYVALTRAKDQLYICGASSRRSSSRACWHDMAMTGLSAIAVEIEENGETILQLGTPGERVATDSPVTALVSLPDWLQEPAPATSSRRLRASARFVGAETARARGNAVHTLLEFLPDMDQGLRPIAAARYLQSALPMLATGQRDMLAKQAIEIVEAPAFAVLFGPGSMAEAPFAGTIQTADGPAFMSGRFDRLVEAPDGSLLVVDYKSDAQPPPAGQLPSHYRDQLRIYGQVLAQTAPDRPIRTAILWTALPRLDWIDLD